MSSQFTPRPITSLTLQMWLFCCKQFSWVCNISFNIYWTVLINKVTPYEFSDSALMVGYWHKNYWPLHLHQFFIWSIHKIIMIIMHPPLSHMAYISSCIRLWTSGTFCSFCYHKSICKMTLIWSNPPQIKHHPQKYITVNFHTLNIQSMSDSTCTYLYQSVPVFLTLPLNIPIHCHWCTALLKTLQSLLASCVAMPLWSTDIQETLLLDSSSWGRCTVPSREPLTLYSCFMLSLVCSSQHLPSAVVRSRLQVWPQCLFMELPVLVALFLVLNVP
jgi:hypothetical protein